MFKLSQLARKYRTRLEQMGRAIDGRVHTTRLKNRLLAQFLGMCAQSCGKEVLLVCDEDIGNALSAACQLDADMDAMHLVNLSAVTCSVRCQNLQVIFLCTVNGNLFHSL